MLAWQVKFSVFSLSRPTHLQPQLLTVAASQIVPATIPWDIFSKKSRGLAANEKRRYVFYFFWLHKRKNSLNHILHSHVATKLHFAARRRIQNELKHIEVVLWRMLSVSFLHNTLRKRKIYPPILTSVILLPVIQHVQEFSHKHTDRERDQKG